MSLKKALEMFMLTMNNMFVDILDKRVVVFLDDVIMYSTMVEEHFKPLEKLFTCLYKHAFYCKLKKYSFLQKTAIFLGFLL